MKRSDQTYSVELTLMNLPGCPHLSCDHIATLEDAQAIHDTLDELMAAAKALAPVKVQTLAVGGPSSGVVRTSTVHAPVRDD